LSFWWDDDDDNSLISLHFFGGAWYFGAPFIQYAILIVFIVTGWDTGWTAMEDMEGSIIRREDKCV
jgi:hypothetical protein